ncbi:tetratricopeptide (TPR) repeat protein [Crossiella equi]|uniref:Tetratricopeptide (TPR) repeat protein n=1 Tax=Crossiella equi TaxID=130796 RepID=A0ABS5AG16_9PSEU|nr:tetratricopeptide repeat protein [Crossiella equi]MBP2475287.1 tetratricopeptide (TPR) repeat protein [Crossiella equi]
MASPLFAYRIDPETLWEHSDDPAALTAWLTTAAAQPVPGNPAVARQHHTMIGVAARILRRLDLAEHHLSTALRLAEEHGPAASEVLARSRLAHVLQWQGRHAEAIAEFDRCLVDGSRTPELGTHFHFIFQHAGQCYYDAGEWAAARHCFATALRLRGGAQEPGDPQLWAWEATDSVLTARAVERQLNRLLTAVYQAAAERGGAEVTTAHGLPEGGELLLELRTLLLSGPVLLPVVRAIHRQVPDLDLALDHLAEEGWLARQGRAVLATARCRAMLAEVVEVVDRTAGELWPAPGKALTGVDLAVGGAVGTSDGAAFDAWVGARYARTESARLVDGLCALRYHRADVSAAAWEAEGLAPCQGRGEDPAWRRAEVRADRMAARPYRLLARDQRAALVEALTTLP